MGGSVSYTSTAAPASRPSFSAAARAALSTTGPLAVLMRIADGFIRPISRSPIIPLVCSVRGTCREAISLSLNSSSSSTMRTPSTCFGLLLKPSTLQPNAFASCAVRVPMAPMPIMPNVFPESSSPTRPVLSFPARTARSHSMMRRYRLRARPNTSSETAVLEYPAQLLTRIPLSRQ